MKLHKNRNVRLLQQVGCPDLRNASCDSSFQGCIYRLSGPRGNRPVSDVMLFPLSYTAQAAFGIDRRNQEDYVLRLPTQSF